MSGNEEEPEPPPELYKLALQQNWVELAKRVFKEPIESQYVNPIDNTTALHVAVKARTGISSGSSSNLLSAIHAILEVYPKAACVADKESGFTPLHYACMTTDDTITTLEEDHQIIKAILVNSPSSVKILSTDGYSPIDLHIMCFSKAKRERRMLHMVHTSKPDWTTTVLKTLLEGDEYDNTQVAKKLELLFDCNSFEILEHVATAEADASSSKFHASNRSRSSGSSVGSEASTTVSQLWIWDWVLCLLEAHHRHHHQNLKPLPPFLPLHAAAQVKDCPMPFLMLAMRTYPEQVRSPDNITGNLPLHYVAGWQLAGDQSSASRKSMALIALASEYPLATTIKNQDSKTPMSLALDTGTLWNCGVRKLTTYQKALESPTSVKGIIDATVL